MKFSNNAYKNIMVVLSLFLFALLIYIFTIPPTISGEDSAQFSLTAYTLSISQPTGYPLFNLLGKLFTFIPAGDVGFRINLFCAYFASLSILLLYFLPKKIFLLIYRSTSPPIRRVSTSSKEDQNINLNLSYISFFTSFFFIFSYSLWCYVVIAKTYTLHYFLTILQLLTLFAWREEFIKQGKNNIKYLYLFAFLIGLSLTNHFTTLFILPIALYLIIVTKRYPLKSVLNLVVLIICFILPFSVYFYLPLRTANNISLNWGEPDNFYTFLFVITKFEWHKAFVGVHFHNILLKFIGFFWLAQQYTLWGCWFALLGIFITFKYYKDFSRFCLVSFLIIYGGLALISSPPHGELLKGDFLLIIFYIILALLVGIGIEVLRKILFDFFSISSPDFKTIFKFSLLIIITSFTLFNFLDLNFKQFNHNNQRRALIFGKNLLESIEKNSILLTLNVNPSFICWYLQEVEGIRGDVWVAPVDFLNFPWMMKELKKKRPEIFISSKIRKSLTPFYSHIHQGKESQEILKELIRYNKNKYPFYLNYDGSGRLFSWDKLMVIFEEIPIKPHTVKII